MNGGMHVIMRSISEPFGFVYQTTNWVNGKRYIGQRVFDSKGAWRSYLGSGVILKQAIDKYGKDNFTKEIVDIAYSQGDLDLKEELWIHSLSATFSEDYYNISGGERADFLKDMMKRQDNILLEKQKKIPQEGNLIEIQN